MVEDISRLMDHLNIPKAHIAGYSLGGFIVLKFLCLHPDRVQSAAICAAGWKNPDDPSPIPDPYGPPGNQPAAEPAQPAAEARTGMPSVLDRIRSAVGESIIRESAKHALKQGFRDLGVSRADLESNQVPAVCFIGSQDGLWALGDDLHKHMANLEFVEIPGASHFTTPFYGQFRYGLRDFFMNHPMNLPKKASS